MYTSGTTGNPKGVMLSHDNYIWTAHSLENFENSLIKSNPDQDRIVSYLPLSHVAGQLFDIVMPLKRGIHVYFAEPTAL